MLQEGESLLHLKDSLDGIGESFTKSIRGRVKMYELDDDFGNPILKFDKENLVVLRGRTFALEKLFNDPIDATTSGYKSNLNRTICLFKIGSGGADVQSSPFEPYKPMYSDEDLAIPVPFVIEDPKKYASAEKSNNPSIIESMTAKQKKRYYLPSVKDTGVTEYYGKVFEATPQWVFNKITNEVYKKITLRIEANEARGFFVNELGLVLAEYDGVNNVYRDSELATRVTFDTEPFTSLTKSVLIEYLIYA